MATDSFGFRLESRQPIRKRRSSWKPSNKLPTTDIQLQQQSQCHCDQSSEKLTHSKQTDVMIMGSNESVQNLEKSKNINTICESNSMLDEKTRILKDEINCVLSRNSDMSDSERENPGSVKDVENNNLRELLLLNLDLVQQLREMIIKKDEKINALENDNKVLNSKLERMDRRMSVLKQKELGSGSPNMSVETVSSYIPAGGPHFPLPAESTSHYSRISKKRQLSDSKPHSPEHEVHISPIAKRQKIEKNVSKKQQSLKRSRQREKRRAMLAFEGETEEEVIKRWLSDLSPNRTRIRGEPNVHRTDHPYYINENLSELIDDTIDPFEDICKKTANETKTAEPSITVPSWRISNIPTGYNMEGTENLDDEIYLKRHAKPEQEEKRRKRWDIQRMRELQKYEKLQEGRCANKTPSKLRPFTSSSIKLLPSIDDVKYVEICDFIPVNTFGSAIPKLKESEFDLPWFDNTKELGKIKSGSKGKKK